MTHRSKFVFVTTLIALTSSIWASATTPNLPLERINRFVEERRVLAGVPGISVVMVQNDAIVYSHGYGLANIKTKTPMTDATLLEIGSTTKSMTALAVMQLVEAGKLELDQTVKYYLPWFTTSDKNKLSDKITLRQCLTHTSGLSDESIPHDTAMDDLALERWGKSFKNSKLEFAPGSKTKYSNFGYALLGLIVQKVSGISFEQYLTDNLFKPLEMQRTTLDPKIASELGLAQGYRGTPGSFFKATPRQLGRLGVPAGSLTASSARDVGNYLIMQLNGGQFHGRKIINPESLLETQKPQVNYHFGIPTYNLTHEIKYGFGWRVFQSRGLNLVAHNGTVGRMGSVFLLAPDQKMGVAVLWNLEVEGLDLELMLGLLDFLRGDESAILPAPSSTRATKTIKTNLETFTEKYTSSEGKIEVRINTKNQLELQKSDAILKLEPTGKTSFVVRNAGEFNWRFQNLRLEFKAKQNGMNLEIEGKVYATRK
jgi:CubicO group peptidase (beta-lactamase class C family)